MTDDIVITIEPWEVNENVGLMFEHGIYDDDLYESMDRYEIYGDARKNDTVRRRNTFERTFDESCFDFDCSSSSSASSSSARSLKTGDAIDPSKNPAPDASSDSSSDSSSNSSIDSPSDSSSDSSSSASMSCSTESRSSFSDSRSSASSSPLSSFSISPSFFATGSTVRNEPPMSSVPKKETASRSFLDELFGGVEEGGKNSAGERAPSNDGAAASEERDDFFEYVDETHLHDILDGLYHRRDENVHPIKKSGTFHARNSTRVAFGTTFDDVRYVNFDDGPFVKIIDSTNGGRASNDRRQKSESTLGILGPDEKVWTIESIRTSVALADIAELNNLSKSTLKKLLLRLHPDKNRNSDDHECRSLFDKVYRVYSTKQ